MKRLAAFALLAFGCTVAVPQASVRRELALTIHGDTRFSEHERLLAEGAAERMRTVTRGRARIRITWDLDEDTLLERAWSAKLVRTPSALAGMAHARTRDLAAPCGWVTSPPVVVHVVAEACPELFPVLWHELGHVAGLEDHEGPGVMSAQGAGWVWTAGDQAECERAGVCAEGDR